MDAKGVFEDQHTGDATKDATLATGTGRPTRVALPDGTFGTSQDAKVREIQTVGRWTTSPGGVRAMTDFAGTEAGLPRLANHVQQAE